MHLNVSFWIKINLIMSLSSFILIRFYDQTNIRIKYVLYCQNADFLHLFLYEHTHQHHMEYVCVSECGRFSKIMPPCSSFPINSFFFMTHLFRLHWSYVFFSFLAFLSTVFFFFLSCSRVLYRSIFSIYIYQPLNLEDYIVWKNNNWSFGK